MIVVSVTTAIKHKVISSGEIIDAWRMKGEAGPAGAAGKVVEC